MGGNALGTQAARLTVEQYDALLAHLRATLGDYFGAIEVAPALTTKASHGDIDALIAWDGATWENAKGRAEGVVVTARGDTHASTPTPAVATPSLSDTLRAAGLYDTTLTSPREQLDAWCDAVARACGGTHWVRSGHEMSVAVPVGVIGGGAAVTACADGGSDGSDGGAVNPVASPGSTTPAALDANGRRPIPPAPNSFYQADLMFLPPAGVPFQVWSYAYSSVVLILSHLIRAASGCRGFVMHGHCAVLRWAPYPGVSRVDVHLTHDAATLCGYLGLDYAQWEATLGAAPADSLDEVFAWFATCHPDSRAARGLRRLAAYGGKDSRPNPRRMRVLDEFGAYLREHGWEPEERKPKPQDEADSVAAATNRPPLHPDDPSPLPPAYAALLRYFDKEDEYTQVLKTVRPAATVLWEAHERRLAKAANASWCIIL